MTVTASKAELTEQRLLACAKAEFMEKGFAGANLRFIAQRAGMTTGAIYRYFSNKDVLFKAVVGPAANHIQSKLEEIADRQLELLNMEGFITDLTAADTVVHQFVDYIYENFDVFDLLLNHAAGSSMEGFINSLIELDIASTQAYIDKMLQLGLLKNSPPARVIALLVKQNYKQLLEIVTSKMTRVEANEYIRLLVPFLYAGWCTILEKTDSQ
nr:TetR/AcrR family transcriptional regulator [Paenibacillus silvae]